MEQKVAPQPRSPRRPKLSPERVFPPAFLFLLRCMGMLRNPPLTGAKQLCVRTFVVLLVLGTGITGAVQGSMQTQVQLTTYLSYQSVFLGIAVCYVVISLWSENGFMDHLALLLTDHDPSEDEDESLTMSKLVRIGALMSPAPAHHAPAPAAQQPVAAAWETPKHAPPPLNTGANADDADKRGDGDETNGTASPDKLSGGIPYDVVSPKSKADLGAFENGFAEATAATATTDKQASSPSAAAAAEQLYSYTCADYQVLVRGWIKLSSFVWLLTMAATSSQAALNAIGPQNSPQGKAINILFVVLLSLAALVLMGCWVLFFSVLHLLADAACKLITPHRAQHAHTARRLLQQHFQFDAYIHRLQSLRQALRLVSSSLSWYVIVVVGLWSCSAIVLIIFSSGDGIPGGYFDLAWAAFFMLFCLLTLQAAASVTTQFQDMLPLLVANAHPTVQAAVQKNHVYLMMQLAVRSDVDSFKVARVSITSSLVLRLLYLLFSVLVLLIRIKPSG